MRNVRFLISYDGSKYFGWQRQDGFVSVQETLEEAILSVTSRHATVHGAGRTDTGVHALGQVAHAHVETRLEDERLLFALNAHLPESVVLRGLETCREDFHARFQAVSKRYLYRTETSRFPSPFGHGRSHWTPYGLDLGAMRVAAQALLGRHDFRAFSSTGSPRASTVREVQRIHFLPRQGSLSFVVQANGFLYNMVRTIAGTLLDVGRGRLSSNVVRRALETGERKITGPTAPAAGLYLLSVQYPEPVFVARALTGSTVRPKV
ncbi:MAG: tRNA pseudouridine(38-40) synthase TruA [Planctomycetota bacterium]